MHALTSNCAIWSLQGKRVGSCRNSGVAAVDVLQRTHRLESICLERYDEDERRVHMRSSSSTSGKNPVPRCASGVLTGYSRSSPGRRLRPRKLRTRRSMSATSTRAHQTRQSPCLTSRATGFEEADTPPRSTARFLGRLIRSSVWPPSTIEIVPIQYAPH